MDIKFFSFYNIRNRENTTNSMYGHLPYFSYDVLYLVFYL